jgi:hypothetical protein
MREQEDSSRYVSPRAVCPRYRCQKFHAVGCSGEGCTVTLLFPTYAQRTEHLQKFCEKDYEACGVYGAAQTGTL